MRLIYGLCLAVVIYSVSCTRTPKNDNTLARVGNHVLTVEDVQTALGSSYESESALSFIKEWVDLELLAQEARKKKLDRTPRYKQQKALAEGRLLAAALLESELQIASGGKMDSLVVRSYFDAHRQEYVRQEAAYQIAILVYNDLIAAWEVRKDMDHGTFFREAQQQNQGEPLDFARLPFVTYSQLDTLVASYITTLPVGEISMPRLVNGKAYIYWLVSIAPAGTASTLEEVIDQVRRDASVKVYQESVAAYKEGLRKSSDYYYNEEAVVRTVSSVKGAQ